MEMKKMLITHKPTRQPKKGDVIIHVTDMFLHTKEFLPTPSVGKKIVKALGKNEATRVYVPSSGDIEKDKQTIQEKIHNDPELMKLVQETNVLGGKVFFSFPKGGAPTQFGKDVQTFLESKNGKRLLRGIAKEDIQDKI
jgi:hypothetical protein